MMNSKSESRSDMVKMKESPPRVTSGRRTWAMNLFSQVAAACTFVLVLAQTGIGWLRIGTSPADTRSIAMARSFLGRMFHGVVVGLTVFTSSQNEPKPAVGTSVIHSGLSAALLPSEVTLLIRLHGMVPITERPA